VTPSLVFDLETIPDAAGIRALNDWPDTLSDEEIVERAQQARIEAVGHDFLPLHLQRIVAIGCVFRDNDGFQVKCIGQAEDPEEVLIRGFFKTIERYTPQLVSWNGSGFDLPVLHYRSLIHGIQASRYWDMGEDDRDFKFNNYISRYHQRHCDLMDLLAKYNGRANAPLDQLAKLCGFPGKLGMDGSQVFGAWTRGEFESVRAYCETDVVNTWLMFCRFNLMRGYLSSLQYENEVDLVRRSLQDIGSPHWQEYLAAWT